MQVGTGALAEKIRTYYCIFLRRLNPDAFQDWLMSLEDYFE
jgi:hypothetical protein